MDTNTINSQENPNLWSGYDTKNKEIGATKVSENSARTPKSEMGKEAFLTLLMTQMKYQDPLNPVEDAAFLAQLAQFSALEQMQNMNKSVSQVQSYSMMGKYVQGENFDNATNTSEIVEGVVDAVKTREGETFLIIGDKELPAHKVENVLNGQIENLSEIGESTKSMPSEDVSGFGESTNPMPSENISEVESNTIPTEHVSEVGANTIPTENVSEIGAVTIQRENVSGFGESTSTIPTEIMSEIEPNTIPTEDMANEDI